MQLRGSLRRSIHPLLVGLAQPHRSDRASRRVLEPRGSSERELQAQRSRALEINQAAAAPVLDGAFSIGRGYRNHAGYGDGGNQVRAREK